MSLTTTTRPVGPPALRDTAALAADRRLAADMIEAAHLRMRFAERAATEAALGEPTRAAALRRAERATLRLLADLDAIRFGLAPAEDL